MSPVKTRRCASACRWISRERVRRPEAVELLQIDRGGDDGRGGLRADYSASDIWIIPPRGIINVHASLLPKYRGAAPIQWAIAHGETRTGVTTMQIDAGLDTGDMLLKGRLEMGLDEKALELGARLAPGARNC